jgi:hypothetical protein
MIMTVKMGVRFLKKKRRNSYPYCHLDFRREKKLKHAV